MLNRIRPELRIFIFSCATYIVAGFMSTLTSTLMAYFAADTGMTSGMQGIFLSMGGLMTAIVASLPGRVVDRFGTKKTLYLIAAGLLASLLLFSTAHSGIECMIWFSLYSLVTAASVPCSTQALKVYRVEDPSKLLRINLIGNMVAGMVAASFSAALIETMGLTWRQAFLVFAGISALESTCLIWGSTYLSESAGLSADMAAAVITFYFAGMTLGRILSGLLSVKYSDWQIIFAGEAVILISVVILLADKSITAVIPGLFLIGLGNGPVFPNMTHITPVLYRKETSQSVIGIQMAFSNLSIMLTPVLFGVLADVTGPGIFPGFLLVMFVLMAGCTAVLKVGDERSRR